MPKSILIADDTGSIRKAVRLVLEEKDGAYICAEAVDGSDAVEKAKQLKPDLIVLDFSMPVMNGLDAAKVLRREMPAVPLILFTMHMSTALEAEARSAGFRAVVSKMQGLGALVNQIQVLTETSSDRKNALSGS